MPETLYVIDVFSLVFQVFHAIGQEMTSRSGLPTNAVYGFTRDLNNLLRLKEPTYLLAAMDIGGPAQRGEWFPAYKANRSEMPENLVPQIPLIEQVLEAFGIPIMSCPKWEADDVIATVTRLASERGIHVAIVTSDKDARQLLSPQVRLYNTRKDTYLGVEDLWQDWGVRPDQVIDFQSLVGDPVDNVPGIPLVGPKKASALLQQFGDLETVLANADKAPGAKLRENLRAFAEQARSSRRLVKLYDDLPIEVDWDRARAGQLQSARLRELFTEFGFKRLADEVLGLAERNLFSSPAPAPAPPPKSDRTWVTVDTPDKFAEFLTEFLQQTKFCVDLETTGLDAVRADIVGWAFSWQAGRAFYIPVRGPVGQAMLDPVQVADALRPHLERTDIEVINQNIKYDLLVLRRAGIMVRSLGLDPMVGDYLLEAGARSHGLDELAKRYLGHTMIPITELIGTGKNQKSMTQVDIAKVAEYASEDADYAWQLAEKISARLREEKLWDLYWNLERPLINVLADMEHTGIKVNADQLREYGRLAEIRLAEMVEQIYLTAGREFNIDSPVQLRQILFTELQLPVQKRTKTGPSTDQEVLEKLAPLHPLPALIIDHRRLSKLKNTYLDALPTMVNPDTGRIHASFNQVVAATGRLSSSDPNLQNIPIRTEEGRRIRSAFLPGEPGWKLLCADYSQIELRMLAHFSQDPALITAFTSGQDIHTAVASDVFGVDPRDVDAEQRRIAKAVNFGVLYGQTEFGLSIVLGIPRAAAFEYIEGYFTRYAGVATFLEKLLKECYRNGYAETILGRRRRIDGIRPSQSEEYRRQLNLPERTATNAVIQGSAADLIKQAMIRLHTRLQEEQHPARMLLQIHDELVFESPADAIPSLAEIVRYEMEQALKVDVPLKVDIGVGDNWEYVESL